MNGPNGHANGKGNGRDQPNVTSLEEARRRAADKVKAEKRAVRSSGAGSSGAREPRTLRDWLIGGTVIALALGYVAALLTGQAPLFGGGG